MFPFAQIPVPPQPLVPAIASAIMGAALFVLSWTVRNALASDDLEQDTECRYDVNRINELRRQSSLYRFFYPLIQLFAALNRGFFRDSLPEVGRQIRAAGLSRFWTPEEYLARLEV